MRKVVAAINMTIDGYCDHTAVTADGEIHDHYSQLLRDGGVLLYGNTTYQLMKYWQTLLEKPSDEKDINDFAMTIDRIPKIVFSTTLKDPEWKTAKMADRPLEETVLALRKEPGRDILVGSRSLIIHLLNLNLIDEFQLCIHPVVAGKGLPLFDHIADRKVFNLSKTKQFRGGAIVLYYTRA